MAPPPTNGDASISVRPADPLTDPFAMLSGWDASSMVVLAMLVCAAVAALWYGTRRLNRERGGNSLRPRGRVAADHGGRHFGAAWRAKATRLEGRSPVSVASAQAGAVRIVGTIVTSAGSLGGPAERACVWRNRAGARPDSAVGAELIVIADSSGHCGVEQLEGARVTAPAEKVGMHYEWTSLYVGDEVEVIGMFEADRTGGATDDPREVVYGTVGSTGPLEVRLLTRPDPLPQASATEPKPSEARDP